VAFTYRRSVGGATERFLAGLARGELWGSRAADGRVVVPPVDHDPETGTPSQGFVPLGNAGVVRTWTWVAAPRPEHPLDRQFAFALVQLDGADTALLHVVDVDEEHNMATGMRVHADWASVRTGSVLDIRAFVPDRPGAPRAAAPSQLAAAPDEAPAPQPASGELGVVSDVRLEYVYEPGRVLSHFLRALGDHRIEGGRCPSCQKVYVPPHLRCPGCGTGPLAAVDLRDRGTIVSYTIVHLPFHGMTIELPYAWGWIRLDGADVPFAHLLGEVALDELRVGQRVEAVWVADEELGPTWESIRHFRPLAE
jgi:uncharacterized OB-fold protein